MAGIEVSRNSSSGDPNLLGDEMHCNGQKSGENNLHPAGKGDVEGLRVHYTTWDNEGKFVEDRSSTELRGCIRFNRGVCSKGGGICPVAGAVSIEDYRKRIEELKKLQIKSR